MNMKRVLSWILIFVMCLALLGCDKAGSDKDKLRPQTQANVVAPLLYKVTDDQGNVVWLFGSIHAGRESFYPLPDYVLNAFDGADKLAVEFDIIAHEKDIQQQAQAMSYLLYRDGTNIKDHIPKELYDQAVAVLKENNTYLEVLDMYCPATWSSLIESLAIENLSTKTELGVDRHLLERAKDAGKEIADIESAAFQSKMLAGFSDELQIVLLQAALEMYADQQATKNDLQDMMDLWASGDEEAFIEYLTDDESAMSPEEQRLQREYNQAVLTNRNVNMANYAISSMSSGKEVFICVGAAHIVGPGALVDLLSAWGYTVERVQ